MGSKNLLAATLILALLLPSLALTAQHNRYKERLEEARAENWPPPKVYSRVSLGYALQGVFKKHFDFCGFSTGSDRRDYVPGDISRFLGRRDLRTKVETADINGGGLLYYIFATEELNTHLDHIRFDKARVLQMEGVADQFVINADENFDAFLLTKNCSGYLKASLDTGIEPPYSAFEHALSTDDRRESTVMAVSGAFASPLRPLLRANDQRTNELLLKLWRFYRENPRYIDQAYYLSGFEGVMVRHLSQTQQNDKLATQVGININIPLLASWRSDLQLGRTRTSAFSGTDWETIVYADFDYNYPRERLFAPLPAPVDINRHFAALRPAFQKQKDFPLMTEGAEHRHFLSLEGVPKEMCSNFWVIEDVAPGVYAEMPRLQTQYYTESDGSFGCRYTVSGRPAPVLFQGAPDNRPGKVNLAYRIRSREPVGGQYIYLHIREELQTSTHPTARLADGRFDLSTRQDRRFAFQWKVALEIEDSDNPVDFNQEPYVANLNLWRGNERLDAEVVKVEADAQRRLYFLTLETRSTWPLHRINDRNMQTYNLTMDVHLPGQRTAERSVRPVKGIVSFPSLYPEEPPAPKLVPNAVEVPATDGNGDGGGNG